MRTVIEVNGDGTEKDIEEADNGVMSDTGAITGQYRCWFFTINNPSEEWDGGGGWALLRRVVGDILGGVYQHEKVTVDHIQGCFKLSSKTRPTTMKNKFRSKNIRGWIRPCIDYQKSVTYCTKDESRVDGPYFHGELTPYNKDSVSTQGKRTDLDQVAADISAGMNLKQVALTHSTSFIKYHGGIDKYFSVVSGQKPRDFVTELHIYWGAPGTGKSRRAWHEARKRGRVYELPVAKDSNVIWWPGYSGEETVILDDFYGWFPFHSMLKMIDRYEWKVRTSGDSFVQFTSKVVVITSNSNWPTWYQNQFMKEGYWKAAFERRITLCEEFGSDTAWVPPEETMAAAAAAMRVDVGRQELLDLDPGNQASPISRNIYMEKRHQVYCTDKCDCKEFFFNKFGFDEFE